MLFKQHKFGGLELNNRIVMAPMTRSRTTQPDDLPNELMAKYYQQRATAGLIITEGAPISSVGRGYSMTPGIYTQEQIDGWKLTTDAVHKEGGKIFIQLWHVGRRAHLSTTGDLQPVSSSSKKDPDQVFGKLPDGSFGMVETDQPRALSIDEIKSTIQDFVQASKNAIEAGFDGVEIHGAHGYLIDQFLRSNINDRTDEYGGSIDNRMKFMLEIVTEVANAIGGDKTAIRLSPHVVEGCSEDDPEIIELTLKALEKMNDLNLAYIHFSENISNYKEVPQEFRKQVRQIYKNPIMVAGKRNKETAQEELESGLVDLVAFGQPFITNPDFVYRIKNNLELNPVDYDAHATFYGGNEKGYTDYPMIEK